MENEEKIEQQRRGQLTNRIKVRSLEVLGYEIDVTELRLMPYVMFVMMNKHSIDPNCINDRDRDILSKWEVAGNIELGLDYSLRMSKPFWDMCCEIVYLGYVDLL